MTSDAVDRVIEAWADAAEVEPDGDMPTVVAFAYEIQRLRARAEVSDWTQDRAVELATRLGQVEARAEAMEDALRLWLRAYEFFRAVEGGKDWAAYQPTRALLAVPDGEGENG